MGAHAAKHERSLTALVTLTTLAVSLSRCVRLLGSYSLILFFYALRNEEESAVYQTIPKMNYAVAVTHAVPQAIETQAAPAVPTDDGSTSTVEAQAAGLLRHTARTASLGSVWAFVDVSEQ